MDKSVNKTTPTRTEVPNRAGPRGKILRKLSVHNLKRPRQGKTAGTYRVIADLTAQRRQLAPLHLLAYLQREALAQVVRAVDVHALGAALPGGLAHRHQLFLVHLRSQQNGTKDKKFTDRSLQQNQEICTRTVITVDEVRGTKQ
jgi:hypothetical protein